MRPLAVIGNVNVDLILGPAAPWPKPALKSLLITTNFVSAAALQQCVGLGGNGRGVFDRCQRSS